MAVGLGAASQAGPKGVPPSSSSKSRSERGQGSGHPGKTRVMSQEAHKAVAGAPAGTQGVPFP